jgi:hypothetical protein
MINPHQLSPMLANTRPTTADQVAQPCPFGVKVTHILHAIRAGIWCRINSVVRDAPVTNGRQRGPPLVNVGHPLKQIAHVDTSQGNRGIVTKCSTSVPLLLIDVPATTRLHPSLTLAGALRQMMQIPDRFLLFSARSQTLHERAFNPTPCR